jgi:hypothetical protein
MNDFFWSYIKTQSHLHKLDPHILKNEYLRTTLTKYFHLNTGPS